MWLFRERSKDQIDEDPHYVEHFRSDDTFAIALVRETIQNSIDAAIKRGNSVSVRFTLKEVPAVARQYFSDLESHLKSCKLETHSISNNAPLKCLIIEDFGTKGLSGSLTESGRKDAESGNEANFYHFWRSIGKSGKHGRDGGRWGLGKTVFPASSQIRSFMGLSVSYKDEPNALFGLSILKQHEEGNKSYDYYGYYTASEQGKFQEPYTNESMLSEFTQIFGLSREPDASGLSIVIPIPEPDITEAVLIRAVLEHYFYPIISGQLTVYINSFEIDRDTIEKLIQKLEISQDKKEEYYRHIEFLTAARDFNLTQIIQLPDEVATQSRISQKYLSSEQISTLKERFNSGQMIALKIPINIKEQSGKNTDCAFKVFLQQTIEDKKGKDFYVRDGLTVSDMSHFGNRQAFGLFVSEEDALSSFLGDSENPAHTRWTNNDIVKSRYKNAQRVLSLVSTSLADIYDLLTAAEDNVVEDAFRQFFWLEEPEGAGSKKQQKKHKKVKVPPLTPKPKLYTIQQIQGGAKVISSEHLTEELLPLQFKATFAYDTERGNPFKVYSPFDFALQNKTEVSIESSGADCVPQNNVLQIAVHQKDFEIVIKGFDDKRDLLIRVA